MLLMSGSMSADLDSTLIAPLCTAAPGFGGWGRLLELSPSPVGCSGNSRHALVRAHPQESIQGVQMGICAAAWAVFYSRADGAAAPPQTAGPDFMAPFQTAAWGQ